MKADIIIPRKQIGGSSNDIGFRRNKAGRFEAIVSDFDSNRHGRNWMNKLNVTCQVEKTMQDAKRNGVRSISKKTLANGDIELVYVKA